MKNLPLELRIEANKLSSDTPFLPLLRITLLDGTVIRLVNNTEDITFQGQVWTAFPFEIEFGGESARGELTFANIKVCNVTQALQPYVEEQGGGVGATVDIIIVNPAHLSANYDELTLSFTCLACSCTSHWITFRLGDKNLMLQRFPLYRYYAKHCNWTYRGIECGYNGPLNNTPCARDLEACRLRGNTARFGGFPGLDARGLRFA